MPKILSVSYDQVLLYTRHQILSENGGYAVTSVFGLSETLDVCRSEQQFDLFIIGHSIPHAQKEAVIQAFREHRPAAAVIALKRQGENAVRDADLLIDPNPRELLNSVANLLFGKAAGA